MNVRACMDVPVELLFRFIELLYLIKRNDKMCGLTLPGLRVPVLVSNCQNFSLTYCGQFANTLPKVTR